jgi:hypothetical protein
MRIHSADGVFGGARVTSFEGPFRKWPTAIAILVVVVVLGLSANRHNGRPRFASALGARVVSDSPNSPYAAAADFAQYIMELRDEAFLKIAPMRQIRRLPWKENIVTTVFWVGEQAGGNNPMPNCSSSWDLNWTVSYGGFDPPEIANRSNYIPVAFIPRQNPFYVALPYNDVTHGQFKPEAPLIIPWFKEAYSGPGQSVCKDHWIAIRKGNRTCYAQWEDCGPFRTDHFQYVFGNERPKPNANYAAGLDVSPAVRDYLGLQPIDVTDWQFVTVHDVPPGPWRSYGDNNPFVKAREQVEVRLAKHQKAPTQCR